MKPPFKLPARVSDERFLVAADCELVAELVAATPEEIAFITTAVNHHERLATALLDLVEAARSVLAQDDLGDAFGAAVQALKDLP